MINKRIIFNILVALVSLDIVLTTLAVGFFGASEINPLCHDFSTFMVVKTVATAIMLFAISKLREIPGWAICVGILIAAYGVALVFNLASILTSLVIKLVQ